MDKPPDSRWFGIGLIICLVLITGTPASTRTPLSENTESLITVQGTTLKASIPPSFVALSGVLGTLTGGLGEYYLYSLISQYDWDIDTAYSILICESKGNPYAVGDTDTQYHSYGLMQIRNLPERNLTIEQLFEPEENIRIAYDIYLKQGWLAWDKCWRRTLTNILIINKKPLPV